MIGASVSKSKKRRRLADLSRAVSEGLAAWQVLRKLDFPSDDLFMGVLVGRVVVELRRGDVRVRIDVGPWQGGDFAAAYKEAHIAMTSATPDELRQHWESSEVRRNRTPEIVSAILFAGISIPKDLA